MAHAILFDWSKCCAGRGFLTSRPGLRHSGFPATGPGWSNRSLRQEVASPAPGSRDGSSRRAEPSYFQQFLDGPSHSALLFAQQEGAAELVGVTRQLLGTPGSPFAYRGNMGPSLVPAPLMSRLRQLGNVLSSAFRLVGLFGVDYIQHDDEPWLVEINPRYTASVEVFELATHRTLLTEHLRACGMDLVESPSPGKPKTVTTKAPVVGKAVLYAQRSMVAPEIEIDDPRCRDSFAVPAIADVPWPGTAIAAGEPIMTMFTKGEDVRECEARLDELETLWQNETVATLPGGWRPVHTIRLEIEPFAELVAHSESLTGSQVDSPDSCRVKLKSAPVTVLQSPKMSIFSAAANPTSPHTSRESCCCRGFRCTRPHWRHSCRGARGYRDGRRKRTGGSSSRECGSIS